MNNKLKNIVRTFILALFWLVFPPLFLVFSIIWKTPRLAYRIVLTVLAPLSIVAIAVLLFAGQQYFYFYYQRGNRSEIEAKTGLTFPKFQSVEKRHFTYYPRFLGDFNMEYTVKLDTSNIREFYRQLDLKLTNKEEDLGFTNHWSKEGEGSYNYTNFGDPKDEDDQTLELNLNKKKALLKVIYGRM